MQIKKYISLIVAIAVILSGLFSYPLTSYGKTITKTVVESGTEVVDDLAYYDIWKHESGVWQNGKMQGSSVSQRYPITESKVPNGAKIVSITGKYNADFNDKNYNDFCVLTGTVTNIEYLNSGQTKQGDTEDLKYTVSTVLNAKVGPLNITQDWQSANVEGWRYFIPVTFTINYTIEKTIEIEIPDETEDGDFEVMLDVPETAEEGETITVYCYSSVDELDGMKALVLERSFDGGSWEHLKTWTGNGSLGVDIGGSIQNTLEEEGDYDFRLTGTDINDTEKSKTETVAASQVRDVSVEAKLTMPQLAYEGHTLIAVDESVFDVDGIAYSAARAYAEGIASNSFKAGDSSMSIKRLTNTKAEVTFTETGYHTTYLDAKIEGKKDRADNLTEVMATPYIDDTLSGFQKQNRKQILDITVATYPGKPLTGYTITLKDKVTGELVRLTPDDPQANTTNIKTRAVTMTQDLDEGFAYITVEFLTKTPAYKSSDPDYTQDFYYEIDVTDSKGDTDTASKTFAVSPDIPPAAAISLDTAFLREEGSNTASIEAEDVTVAADGDDVERTWYFAHGTSPTSYANISVMDGYQKLSFGTDKIVGFNKVGVGKFTVKLFVKEKWTEPTLEEYVTDSDYLTGYTTATSDVLNVAPVVSLALLSSTEQEILLLASSDAEYTTLLNNKTALQQELLANQIDGQIIIKKLLGSTPSTVTELAQQRVVKYPYSTKLRSNGLATEVNEDELLAVDSEKAYFLTYTWADGTATVPKTIRAINPYSGQLWSYTTSRDEDFIFGQDDTGKYLYLIYENSDQTVLLDKRTGAAAGTINTALSEKVWLSDNLAFTLEDGSLYATALSSLTRTLVSDEVSTVARVNGKLEYITITSRAVVRCTLDMETLTTKRRVLVETTSPGDYEAVCIDSTGKAVLWKDTGVSSDTFRGFRAYDINNDLEIQVEVKETYDTNAVYYALDEQGECNYVMEHEEYTPTSPNKHYFKAVNLRTGDTDTYSKSTDAYNSAMDRFAGAFESDDTGYFLFNGWYIYPGGTDYYSSSYSFEFDGTDCSMGTTLGLSEMDAFEENMKISDRILAALHGDNDPNSGYFRLRLLTFPRTLAQETAEVISRFTDKLTFLGDKDTTAADIIASVEAPKSFLKITATKNGYLTLPSLSLQANQTYYYEYAIKPMTDGTETGLTGLTTSMGTTTTNQTFLSDIYYVEKSYSEDFNDSSIDSFFTLSGSIDSGKYGKISDDGSKTITFTVPTGKIAVLSYDYGIKLKTANSDDDLQNLYWRTSIYINGERMYADFPYTVSMNSVLKTSRYMHYQFLKEGINTITVKNYHNDCSVYIDNLKVDLVSTAKTSLDTSLSTRDGDSEGWVDTEGSFETPLETISYGAQAASYYSGALSGTFSELKYSRKQMAYTITVPSGYLIRGFAYPTGQYHKTRTYDVTIGDYEYEMNKSGSRDHYLAFGEKTFLGTLAEGSHDQTLVWSSDDLDDGTISKFNLITYPKNTATSKGELIFNDSFTRCYFIKEASTGYETLKMYLPKGEYLIKDLKLYYIENGQKIYVQSNDLSALSDISSWTLDSGMTASIVEEEEEEADDEYVKIYKKGEKVLYNIFYDDYEEDPSKVQYWQYSHISWPPDTVHPDVGKILTSPIDRFYLSGKYTVTHWQQDNTQRTGTVGDASGYDKESNQVTLTFYVDGEGEAPWITYIKTNPTTVEYEDSYTIKVGVDDTEKDTLTLETEVYLDGVPIKSDTKTGITADENGDYPEQTISGLPKAVNGTYQVICTVSDYSGTGIKSYKFKVEGISAEATVDATSALKSGYGVWATVKTVTENCTASKVLAVLPDKSTVSMVKTGGSGDNLTWQFPANTGTYAEQYNAKYNTTARMVFVPVKWPDETYYSITYNVYDSSGTLLAQTSSKTYINGNMYDNDFTVRSN